MKGEIIIARNIIIIGTPRSGKTTLANIIMQKFNYTLIDVDAIRDVLLTYQPNTIGVAQWAENLSKAFAKRLFNTMKRDLKKGNIGIIIDDSFLTISECRKSYCTEDSDNLIYCLGTSELSPKEMLKAIRKNDTKDDWSVYMKDGFLELSCKHYIEDSQKNKKECEKYNDIYYFDTSKNREKTLEEIVKHIEKNVN